MSLIRLRKTYIKIIVICMLLWIVCQLLLTNDKSSTKSKASNFQTYLEFKDKISRQKYDVNCRSIFEMDKNEIEKAKSLLGKLKSNSINSLVKILDDKNYIFEQYHCPLFRKIRDYDRFNTTNNHFSLAYSILTYSNTEQFERLLKLIYHPNNIYCIHIDSKSTLEFKQSIKSIVDCFDNIFISSKLEDVFYASFNRLQADINCLNDLFNLDSLILNNENFKNKKNYKWKYFLNFASSEFPLRTNSEIIRILQVYNGSNEIEIIKKFNSARINIKWKVDPNENKLIPTNENKTSVPHGFKIVKGYAYIVASRKFAEYVFYDQKSRDLLEWSKDTWSPDEWYWSTLHYNTKYFSESGFKDIENSDRINTLSRFAGWGGEYKCKGKWRHGVCVFSIEDLPEMITRPHFVANKFLLEYDPISYQCMEEWYLQRETIQTPINMFYYCQFLKTHSSILKCPFGF